jgi:hypothetical protein
MKIRTLQGLLFLTKHYPSLLFHFGDRNGTGYRNVRNVGGKEMIHDLAP